MSSAAVRTEAFAEDLYTLRFPCPVYSQVFIGWIALAGLFGDS